MAPGQGQSRQVKVGMVNHEICEKHENGQGAVSHGLSISRLMAFPGGDSAFVMAAARPVGREGRA